jgi:hypothetical protein
LQPLPDIPEKRHGAYGIGNARTPGFYEKIDGENLSALWNNMAALITPEPRSG